MVYGSLFKDHNIRDTEYLTIQYVVAEMIMPNYIVHGVSRLDQIRNEYFIWTLGV